jgi:hypothetical protein
MSEVAKRGTMDDAAGALSATVRQLAKDLERPEFRAGLGTAMVTTALLARTRLPFPAVAFISLLLGAAVEGAYGMALDIHEKLTADAPGSL